jgi:hypothetical protein
MSGFFISFPSLVRAAFFDRSTVRAIDFPVLTHEATRTTILWSPALMVHIGPHLSTINLQMKKKAAPIISQ